MKTLVRVVLAIVVVLIVVAGGGRLVRSSNFTPDADTGIGTWSEQQFIDKFKAFDGAPIRSLAPGEQRENTVMPWLGYAGMTREDLAPSTATCVRSSPSTIACRSTSSRVDVRTDNRQGSSSPPHNDWD